MIPVKRKDRPITPGEVIRERILPKFNITQDELAELLKVSRYTVNQIINGHRTITPSMALRLGRLTGTTGMFWLSMQQRVDLFFAEDLYANELERIPSLALRIDLKDFHDCLGGYGDE